MTIATLGLAVNSGQVSQATPELQKLTAAAGQAEAAATRLAGASNIEAAAQGKATAATHMHTAAMQANNAAMRMASAQRTNLIFQLNDIGVSLASGMNPLMVAIQQGSQIATIYGPGQGGIGAALKETGNIALGIATKFAPVAVAVGVVAAAIAGLTYEINKTSEVQVEFFDVALAGWQMFADQVAAWVAPVFGQIGQWLEDGWNAAAPVLKTAGNAIIGAFVGAFDAVKTTWSLLPSVIGDLVITAVNGIIGAVEGMLNSIIGKINNFMNDVRLKAYAMGFPLKEGAGTPLSPVTFDRVSNPNPGAAGAAAGSATDAFMGAQKDYLGGLGEAWSARAQGITRARAETEDLGKAASAANDNFGKLVDQGLGDLTHWTESFGKAAQSAFSNLGSGIVDAFKKGGDIAGNVLDMLMDKVGQFGETLLNNGLNGLLNAGLGALGGMFGGGTWGVAGGFSGFPGIFGIPGMATGGTVGRGGLSWVGEQGPELLRLPTGAQVIPNGPSMAMAANQNAGMGDIIIHNNMQVMPGATEEDGAAFALGVSKELRRQLPDAIQSYNRNPLRRAG